VGEDQTAALEDVGSTDGPFDEKPAGPRSRKGEQTRARLVAAAKAVFERSGFLDARVSDIAEEAGLSHGSFYHYFDSKDEVFREVVAQVEERLSAPLHNVVLNPELDATPRERISQAIRLHMEAYREEARIMKVIELVSRFDRQVYEARLSRTERYGRQVADSLRQLQRHGLVDPDLDPDIASVVLGSMTDRFPEAWLAEGRIEADFDHGVDQLIRAFTNAMGLKDPVRPRPSRARAARR
jgi:AcrR family transcriptional regulator